MPLVREVVYLVKSLGDVVKSTREIINAVNDGREYLKRYYPNAQKELTDLLEQMQKAIEGLASVTKVISHFRFSIAGDSVDRATADRDLRSFNDYVIAQQEEVSRLKGKIRKLKANCEEVRKLRDNLDARTKTRTWGSMFELFGSKARKRAQELHSVISNFYADDQEMIQLLEDTFKLAEQALADVEDALGPPATQNPYNVPIAAKVLGAYALLFQAPHDELHSLADDLNQTRIAIAPKKST
jgi:chromosome segregation ATPase